MLVIGIDPGKQTGFAIYDTDFDKLTDLRTLTFWTAFQAIGELDFKEVSHVVVELPDSKHVWHKGASSPAALQRQGVNVGSVIREAELFREGLSLGGYTVKVVNPRGKVDATRFNNWTGWTGRSNQHERDAGLLCFGRRYA